MSTPDPQRSQVGSKSCIAAGCCSTGVSPSSAPSLWAIMQGRRAFLFGSFPTAGGRCRTGCCTPPHWFFAVSVLSVLVPQRHRAGRQPMANSKTIAGLIGPSLIALAAALLINLGSMSALVEAVSHDPALVLVSGFLAFVAGLAVVRVHNHWAADWAVLVTIFGWLLLIGGLVRMLFPIWLAGMAATFSPSTGLIVGEAVVFLVIGAFLSYKAYISS